MTKQEKIREGIHKIVKGSVPNFIYPFLMIPTRWLVNKILRYLHSQGVVIKVDGELPDWSKIIFNDAHTPYFELITKEDMLKAGYVAVEPLIKEV